MGMESYLLVGHLLPGQRATFSMAGVLCLPLISRSWKLLSKHRIEADLPAQSFNISLGKEKPPGKFVSEKDKKREKKFLLQNNLHCPKIIGIVISIMLMPGLQRGGGISLLSRNGCPLQAVHFSPELPASRSV